MKHISRKEDTWSMVNVIAKIMLFMHREQRLDIMPEEDSQTILSLVLARFCWA